MLFQEHVEVVSITLWMTEQLICFWLFYNATLNIIFDLIWFLDFFCVINKENSLWLSWHGGSTVCSLINVWFTWWLAEEAVALVFRPALAVERALGVGAGSKRMAELQKTLINICKRRQWWVSSEIRCLNVYYMCGYKNYTCKSVSGPNSWKTLNHW